MEADVVGARIGECLRQRVDRLHHQVHVHRHATPAAVFAWGLSAEQIMGPKVRFGT
jgi:hypothetical protein